MQQPVAMDEDSHRRCFHLHHYPPVTSCHYKLLQSLCTNGLWVLPIETVSALSLYVMSLWKLHSNNSPQKLCRLCFLHNVYIQILTETDKISVMWFMYLVLCSLHKPLFLILNTKILQKTAYLVTFLYFYIGTFSRKNLMNKLDFVLIIFCKNAYDFLTKSNRPLLSNCVRFFCSKLLSRLAYPTSPGIDYYDLLFSIILVSLGRCIKNITENSSD